MSCPAMSQPLGMEALLGCFRTAKLSPSTAYLIDLDDSDSDHALPNFIEYAAERNNWELKHTRTMLKSFIAEGAWPPLDLDLTDKRGQFAMARKKDVQQSYIDYIDSEGGARWQWPIVAQILYEKGDKKLRYHRIFRFPEDYLRWYVREMTGACPPLQIIEIPVPLDPKSWRQQSTIKLYCDWERPLHTMQFLQGSAADRLERARELATKTPRLLIDAMVKLGRIKPEWAVQTVVKEGTRKIGKAGEDDDFKVSFHFIMQLRIPSRLVKSLGEEIMKVIRSSSDLTFHAIEDPGASLTVADDFAPLIGLDKHIFINQFQGLANIYGRKDAKQPCSWPLYLERYTPSDKRILISRPDPNVWTGFQSFPEALKHRDVRNVRNLDPTEVRRAIHYASICVMGPEAPLKMILPSAHNRGIIQKVCMFFVESDASSRRLLLTRECVAGEGGEASGR